MECYPLTAGRIYPELYHVGCTGAHLQIFLSRENWSRYVGTVGAGSPYAKKQDSSFVPPQRKGGSFGFGGYAEAHEVLDGMMCIEVPIFSEKEDGGRTPEMEMCIRTISSILFVLSYFLFDLDQKPELNQPLPQGVLPQLFSLSIYLGEYSRPGSYGVELTVSPRARLYLGRVGNTPLSRGARLMREHYEHLYARVTDFRLDDSEFALGLRRENVLSFKTPGNCACLGVQPPGDPNAGYSLSSHNIDTSFQQTNLLVGIAFVWQMVRDGVLTEISDT